jgi:hypothetical protein
MPALAVTECVAEALQLLAEASKAASEEESLLLLRTASAWLEIAKFLAAHAERTSGE